MSTAVAFLVAFPPLAGLLALVVPGRVRGWVVVGASAVVGLATVACLAGPGTRGSALFGLPGLPVAPRQVAFVGELALAAVLLVLSLRHRRLDALALVVAQTATGLWLELRAPETAPEPDRLLAVDQLTLVMVGVIGLIGPLICVQAVGYMRDYHQQHAEAKGSPRVFFFLLLSFLSAMFGLVFANDLPVLHFFWEVTTLCSFLLIGYTRTEETIGYAFHALRLNLVGGLGFSLAMVWLAGTPTGLDLARLCAGPASTAALLPVALLALAGLTKSAQLPFSSWLLGAMYAPTPTSALLHSSTMVKAGVFLLLRLSPAMAGSTVGATVAVVGFLTFLFAALVATTEPNAKRVLAWSTISNLGLIVGCAGLATPSLAWVGAMLVIFHAAAKSLMFLVVGSLENRLHTKDLESFDHLLARFPRLTVLALVGASGMSLAPFGVVVAKWSAIRALLEVPGWRGAVFLLVMAWGSACTIYSWTKVLLKLVAMREVAPEDAALEAQVTGYEWVAETALAVVVVALAGGLGPLSDLVVGPWALGVFHAPTTSLLHVSGLVVDLLVLSVVALPLLVLGATRRGRYRYAEIYASGRPADGRHVIQTASGGAGAVSLRNYYLGGVVDGGAVFRVGVAVGVAVVVVMILLPAWVRS